MLDTIGDRFKRYELTTQSYLNRRTYTMIRIDGKAFHTFTKGLETPFDNDFIADMNSTAEYLCKSIQGAKLAYVQSDEISILLSDFDNIKSDAWFDYNVQKMVSISASLATAYFNRLRFYRHLDNLKSIEHPGLSDKRYEKVPALAMFDSRVFQLPSEQEVLNYLIWRQKDATKNSISTVAQSLYSPKELHKKNSDQKQELIFQKGINWNDYPVRMKRGGLVKKFDYLNGVKTQLTKVGDKLCYYQNEQEHRIYGPFAYVTNTDVVRSKWEITDPEIFTTVLSLHSLIN